MVIIIAGATHTGKTLLAQRLLEKYKFPYLSIDHLKMGLIRSGQTALTPEDDRELTPYLWSIVREIIKTAVENKQNLIVEGCYIPFDYKTDFTADYLCEIRYVCLIFTESYIRGNYASIRAYESVIEQRGDDEYPIDLMIEENKTALAKCVEFQNEYILIDDRYDAEYSL